MKVFVINLARSTERRATMEQQLSLLNLDYEIVEAVDG
ncbi:glycosyltransferase family 25 protein [Pantoea agglomerans]|nr:glycosyltransferase family 25 protein [Pantoea agglomerans]